MKEYIPDGSIRERSSERMDDIPDSHISHWLPFVVQQGVSNLRVCKISRRIWVVIFVLHPDDSSEKSRIQYGCLSLWTLGGLREPEFVEQMIIYQLCPINFAILHSRVNHLHMNSRGLIMAAYFSSEALVKVGEDLAPLRSHSAALDRVWLFPNLLILFIVDFVQKFDQLSFRGKWFIGFGVSRLCREL